MGLTHDLYIKRPDAEDSRGSGYMYVRLWVTNEHNNNEDMQKKGAEQNGKLLNIESPILLWAQFTGKSSKFPKFII